MIAVKNVLRITQIYGSILPLVQALIGDLIVGFALLNFFLNQG
jgi:hypothetical protein